MRETLSTKTVEDSARQLLEQRLVPLRTAAIARGQRVEAERALEALRKDDAVAYEACRSAGWSADELTRVGLSSPTGMARAKTATRRSAKVKSLQTDPAPTPESSSAA